MRKKPGADQNGAARGKSRMLSDVLGHSGIPAGGGRLIDVSTIIIDAKSGTSGAGRGAKVQNLYCEVNEKY